MSLNARARAEVIRRIQEEEERARERLGRIRHKIAVLSVKGGVGKSFLVANIAVALAIKGKQVGVLDADVHGPSIPRALGLQGLALVAGPEGIVPALGPSGVKVVSIGLMLSDERAAVVWRGPMKTAFIRQVLSMTAWGELDYLLVDLPPGTGDEQLTIAHLISDLDGLLVVTIPSILSSSIASKAGEFAKSLKVRILGVVENMSYFRCPSCGAIHRVFGEGGGKALAEALGAPLLATLPLDPLAASSMDKGTPIVLEFPEIELSKSIVKLASVLEEIVEEDASCT